MPVKDHNTMLSKQYLLSTYKPDHPKRANPESPPPPRTMKETLKTKFRDDILPLIPEHNMDNATYKLGLKTIHTESVRETISRQQPNPVLQEPAPKIHRSETLLPRNTRATFCQLRSRYSSILNSYLARINPEVTDNCPECGQANHTTNHLFNCPSKPTNLTTRALWDDPIDAARFLDLDTGEVDEMNDDN